jgi:alkaline phosphatase D
MALVHVWDDHDYGGNDEDKNFANRSDAWQAFDEYYPTHDRPNAANGLWHSFVCGEAEFFILDTRSQRDPNSSTDNEDKSMLDGDNITNDQKQWLKDGLKNSTKTWKFIISSVTFNLYARPSSDDLWHSFTTERDELADYLVDESIEDVIVLSADIHTGGGIDDGTNSGLGVTELTVPHTNLPSGNQNNLGTWSEGVTSGARGYALVTVSSTGVTLEAKGQNGSVRHSYTL